MRLTPRLGASVNRGVAQPSRPGRLGPGEPGQDSIRLRRIRSVKTGLSHNVCHGPNSESSLSFHGILFESTATWERVRRCSSSDGIWTRMAPNLVAARPGRDHRSSRRCPRHAAGPPFSFSRPPVNGGTRANSRTARRRRLAGGEQGREIVAEQIADPFDRDVGRGIRSQLARILGVMSLPREDRRQS